MTGTVSNVISGKGFGFITGDNGQEYFFHNSETQDWEMVISSFTRLGSGKVKVNFEPSKTPKGPRALNVEIVEITEI